MNTEGKSVKELTDELQRMVEKMQRDAANRTTRFKMNKRTHRLRFEAETEDSVEIVIEPREKEDGKNEYRG